MASAKGELFEQGVTAYVERGVAGLAESWHEDVVYEEDPLFPGAAAYSGREAALARFREYEEQLGRGTVVIESVDESEEQVVVVWRHSGVTPGAEVPFEHRWAWVVRLRDGRAAHIRAYLDPDEALRAVQAS
jgi:ketosteroid isomerase-like protein